MAPCDDAQVLLGELIALRTPEDNTTLNLYAERLGEIASRAEALPASERFVADHLLGECMNRLWSLRAASIGAPKPFFSPHVVH
jgi:hypothetical protein